MLSGHAGYVTAIVELAPGLILSASDDKTIKLCAAPSLRIPAILHSRIPTPPPRIFSPPATPLAPHLRSPPPRKPPFLHLPPHTSQTPPLLPQPSYTLHRWRSAAALQPGPRPAPPRVRAAVAQLPPRPAAAHAGTRPHPCSSAAKRCPESGAPRAVPRVRCPEGGTPHSALSAAMACRAAGICSPTATAWPRWKATRKT